MEKAARESLNHPGARFDTGNIWLLAYADDVVMIAENMDEINEMFTPFQNTAGQVGLVCNESKTAIMKMSREGGNRGNMQVGTLNMQYTDKFKYLGALVTERNEMDIEMNERIAAGNRCYHAFSTIMRSRKRIRPASEFHYDGRESSDVMINHYICGNETLPVGEKTS
ncbi:uncharacterized protein LOC143028043 [Oratosquilla oratoria]|uniref:uncharacterized protein LOC143028043 n=1 Tax=Oratosquilla oratoria TaxID=337810 RepID=UPI003F76ACF8